MSHHNTSPLKENLSLWLCIPSGYIMFPIVSHGYILLPQLSLASSPTWMCYIMFFIGLSPAPSPSRYLFISMTEAPTLKSVSNAKPRKRIPTTNGTCDGCHRAWNTSFFPPKKMAGMIKIYGKVWGEGNISCFDIGVKVKDLLLLAESRCSVGGLCELIGHFASTCCSIFHRFSAWVGNK